VVIDHPSSGNTLISANAPHILEQNAFGQMFNTRIEGDKLLTEAWIDPEKAMRLGDDHRWVLKQLRSGNPVEVSIGAMVGTEAIKGLHEGIEYGTRWTQLTPDHLAFLPEGKVGACSIAMGCGALRAASQAELAALQPRQPAGRPDGGQFMVHEVTQLKQGAESRALSKIELVMSVLHGQGPNSPEHHGGPGGGPMSKKALDWEKKHGNGGGGGYSPDNPTTWRG
jgi:hypothetical protein